MITCRDKITLQKLKLKISFQQLETPLDLQSLPAERKPSFVIFYIRFYQIKKVSHFYESLCFLQFLRNYLIEILEDTNIPQIWLQ